MANPIQHFAPWESSLAEHAAGIILAGRSAKPFFDLRGVTIIVPSRFAARLLEEKLGMAAPAGVLGADIVTPEQFLNCGESTAQVSTPESATLAWIETLQGINRQNYAGFFTGNQSGPVPSFDEARALAEDFIKLQQQLGQTAGGMSFAQPRSHLARRGRLLRRTRRRVARTSKPLRGLRAPAVRCGRGRAC